MTTAEQNRMQLNYELAVYKEQIQMIKRETERISLTTVDLTNALKAVEGLKDEKALVPIGGGALVRGSLEGEHVLIPIGAQYLMEMKKENAKIELEKRIEATKNAVTKLTEEFNKIVTKLKDASGQLQTMEEQNRLSQRVDDNIREDYI
ncbi:prefoldin subunit alpha [Candidatus Micrarchaeota archaeon]|nr:prefoldin subunit alpha [Candidatus Micrarchaeota archaeon]MBU1682124.1 prefoldin subunit alpha [Candidatus Micrarchaeota archaeon]